MRGFQKLFLALVVVLGLGVMSYAGYNMYSITHDRSVSRTANQQIADNAVTFRQPETSPRETQPDSGSPTAQTDPTDPTEPRETAPLSVNFPYLQGISQDVIAWIYCEDTPISYPVVLSADNSDYLYRLLDGTSNPSGTLFMDCRNTGEFSETNSIIYGHNMKDGSMFASIEKYCTQEYYDAHPVMYLLTPEGDYLLELIAGQTVSADDESIYATELSPEDAGKRMERSDFRAEVQLEQGDRFVTLSTCAYSFNSARYVVTGVLRALG